MDSSGRDMLAVNFRKNFSLVVCLCRSLILALGIVNYLLKGTPTSEALVCTWWRGESFRAQNIISLPTCFLAFLENPQSLGSLST